MLCGSCQVHLRAVDEAGIVDVSMQIMTYTTSKACMAVCWLLCMSMVTAAP